MSAPDPRDSHIAIITVGKEMRKDFPLTSDETNTKTTQTGNSGAQGAEHGTGANPKIAKAETADACRRRLYIAELLKVLTKFWPKVVVLDLWLDPELCPDQRAAVSFFDELGQFSKQAPVILGLQSRNAADLQADSPADFAYMRNRKPPLTPTELVLMPVTHPPRSSDSRIIEAVARGNSDTRRISLGWRVYDDFPTAGANIQARWEDTLSVAAVRAFDSHQTVLKTIDALNPDGSPKVSTEPPPYTSFLREDQLPIERAIDVICSDPPNESWRNACTRVRVRMVNPTMFRDKIVVIGMAGLGGDIHQSVLGKVPGVILQANYIESLLSNRLFQPLSLQTDLLMGVVWLSGVFTVAWYLRSHPLLALTLSLLATILPAYFILLGLVKSGYYTELLVPLTIAALVTNITIRFHHFLIQQGGA